MQSQQYRSLTILLQYLRIAHSFHNQIRFSPFLPPFLKKQQQQQQKLHWLKLRIIQIMWGGISPSLKCLPVWQQLCAQLSNKTQILTQLIIIIVRCINFEITEDVIVCLYMFCYWSTKFEKSQWLLALLSWSWVFSCSDDLSNPGICEQDH